MKYDLILLPNTFKTDGWSNSTCRMCKNALVFDGDVNLSNMKLKVIPPCFKTVNGNFRCSDNNLTTLEGSPQTVGGDFYCHDNKKDLLLSNKVNLSGKFINKKGCFNNESIIN